MQNPANQAERDSASDIAGSGPHSDELPNDQAASEADHEAKSSPHDNDDAAPSAGADDHASHDDEPPHLSDEIIALVEDLKTLFHSEVSYRRAMAAFIVDRAKTAIISAVIAAVLAILAVFALVFGLIFALSPLITRWGATALVVGVLLIIALILGKRAAKTVGEISNQFRKSAAANDMLSMSDRKSLAIVQDAVDECDRVNEQN